MITTKITYITISNNARIEVLNNEYFPMYRSTTGALHGTFCHYRKGSNGQVGFKTEKSARKYIAEHSN